MILKGQGGAERKVNEKKSIVNMIRRRVICKRSIKKVAILALILQTWSSLRS